MYLLCPNRNKMFAQSNRRTNSKLQPSLMPFATRVFKNTQSTEAKVTKLFSLPLGLFVHSDSEVPLHKKQPLILRPFKSEANCKRGSKTAAKKREN